MALAKYLELIRSAQSSVDIMTFEFHLCDASGQLIFEELLKAKEQNPGLRIRILVDAYKFSEGEWSVRWPQIASSGILLKQWNPGVGPGMNLRNHAKLLLIDRKKLYSGGRNIGDKNFGQSNVYNYIDRDLAIQGGATDLVPESVISAQQGFDRYWDGPVSSPFAPKASKTESKVSECGNAEKILQKKKELEALFGAPSATAPIHRCADVRFSLDQQDMIRAQSAEMSPASLAAKTTSVAMGRILGSVSHELLAENLFFISSELSPFFDQLLKKNIPSTIVTNGAVSDVGDAIKVLNRSSARRYDGPNMSVLLWPRELGGALPLEIHAKTMLIDNVTAVVSSYNLDPRSYKINNEALLEIHGCESLNAELRSKILTTVSQAKAYIEANREAYMRQLNGGKFSDILYHIIRDIY